MSQREMVYICLCSLVLTLASGCTQNGSDGTGVASGLVPGPEVTSTSDDADTTTTPTTTTATDSADENTGNFRIDLANQSDEGSDRTTGDDDGCASVSEMATLEKQPSDILFVVDNSGSMGAEATAVQDNINGFSQQIIDSGIDAHVVLLSSYPGGGFFGFGNVGICVDPPLGSGGCPTSDSNPPQFLHIDQTIDSWNALQQIIARYPDWSVARRPDAALHIVVVSDDNSQLPAAEFDSMFKALDPSFGNYVLHGIVAPSGGWDPTECQGVSTAAGTVYLDLIGMTGGILGNLCLQDFVPVFDELSTQVVSGSSLSCKWPIPDPPMGMDFDKDKVNVEFDDGTGKTEVFARVDTPDDCPWISQGWYYDNPTMPEHILLCPQTCDQVQDVATAGIEIQFGCDTYIPG